MKTVFTLLPQKIKTMKILLYMLVASVITLSACNTTKTEKKTDAKADPKAGMSMMMNPFEAVEIAKSNPLVQLKLAGELAPDQQTELYAKVNSYVNNIKVDIGSVVSAGQVLIVLDAPEIQSQVASAKAKWQGQEAIYLSTKSTYDRMMKANETEGAISKDALDQIKSRKLADEAQLNAAKSAYNELRDVDNYLVIRAPFSGVVTDRNVDLGAYVGPMGKTPLLVIQNTQKLRLNLSIPEANTPYLKIGDTIKFKIRSAPEKKYFARISRKSGTLDLKLRSEKIEADFINVNNELKPFMVAETMIPLQNSMATFFVPKTALVESNLGMYLIRVEGGVTKNVPVARGRVMPDKFEVFGELNEGDQILLKGNEEILEGTSVKK
jgi:membrane fusion protein (multidrug efflux system)